jgi:hypothetical protein
MSVILLPKPKFNEILNTLLTRCMDTNVICRCDRDPSHRMILMMDILIIAIVTM